MYIAVLKFERTSYDCYGDCSTEKTVTLESESRHELDKMIEQCSTENVYQHRGDFNLLMSESRLLSSQVMKIES